MSKVIIIREETQGGCSEITDYDRRFYIYKIMDGGNVYD